MSIPQAEKTPGDGGTITVGMLISLAIAEAWIGPAPPKATRANSRGSYPRLTVIDWRSPDMFVLTILTIPRAASSTLRSKYSAIRLTASRAKSGEISISPPRKYSGSRIPRTRFASVTVGSFPPRM